MVKETQNDEARRTIFAAIREHLTASNRFAEVQQERQTKPAARPCIDERQSAIGLVERFRESVEAVSGRCAVVRDERAATQAVQEIIEQTKARHIAVSNSPLVESVTHGLQWEGELLEGCDASTLFASDLGITGVQWGVAETGTLILESDRERHRLVSLVPPVHIALLRSDQIRETLAEVLGSIQENGEEGLSRAVTLITGPSRTSDIELTLAIGVHGPARLYVVVIDKARE